ncbi:hypothetical protein CANCADRAFT_87624 [Tortispora caseinolytica NRRL Y-17796]|uniref:Alpha/beta hydrolase fold-3 domain-containing protein n=1 Tax=Tortispora caseinolytica NRRL Y-17796 TaxID=767744 RepID=A0A1E4TLA0_9ASCO|nr:hypothetical protein CANCADRAFT_87624 [Tortispora caseinolytica NRRL Y-17796]
MREPIQPIDPEIAKLLPADYVQFWNSTMAFLPKIESLSPIDARKIAKPTVGPGKTPGVKGEDIEIPRTETKGDPIKAKVYYPNTPEPSDGYPVFLYFHGGGFVIGGARIDDWITAYWCESTSAVVVSVDYRHAPEFKFPSPVDDVVDSYRWILCNPLRTKLNTEKVVAGGNSAGANLTTVLTHEINKIGLPQLLAQVLIVPTCDTYNKYDSHERFKHAPGLSVTRMNYFINHYINCEDDRKDTRLSSLLNDIESFKKCPQAFVGIAYIDVLHDEGIEYVKKLREANVPVDFSVYVSPHVIVSTSGKLEEGARMLREVAAFVKKVVN